MARSLQIFYNRFNHFDSVATLEDRETLTEIPSQNNKFVFVYQVVFHNFPENIVASSQMKRLASRINSAMLLCSSIFYVVVSVMVG
jgi:hypothetical protein